ncbi:MAG: hypothetical protein AB1522_12110 [Chloroflexota bacterium]
MNKRLPLGLLSILLIVLLAGVGVAYGLWSETLTIDGTVNTGDVNVEFGKITKSEKVQINFAPPVDEPKEKADAANCSYEVKGATTDSETLVITTEGAYPSWHCIVEFDVVSTGSVPVHVYTPQKISGPSWKDLKITDCRKVKLTDMAESFEGDYCAGVECSPTLWWQLHKGDALRCKLTIHFTNDDKVNEKDTYQFVYKIEARQWNEPRP